MNRFDSLIAAHVMNYMPFICSSSSSHLSHLVELATYHSCPLLDVIDGWPASFSPSVCPHPTIAAAAAGPVH